MYFQISNYRWPMLSFVVVVWISGMLFGRLIEAKKLTILKGISNFFFLLYHLWYVYAFFTYAQVKYALGFPLIMINMLIFFWKEVLYLLNDIYICWGPCSWIDTSPYIKRLEFKGVSLIITCIQNSKIIKLE